MVGKLRILGPSGGIEGDGRAGGDDERPELRVGDGVATDQHRPDVHLTLLARLAEAVPAGRDLAEVVQGGQASRSARRCGYSQLAP